MRMMKSFTFEDLFSRSFDEPVSEGFTGSNPDTTMQQPKTRVISMILNYSRALSVQQTKVMGPVCFMKN